SAEPMALVFGEPEDDGISQNQVLALQRFLTYSPWDSHSIHREIQAIFAERLVPSTTDWPIGTVGVIDESGFVKKGTESVGVQRQTAVTSAKRRTARWACSWWALRLPAVLCSTSNCICPGLGPAMANVAPRRLCPRTSRFKPSRRSASSFCVGHASMAW